MKQPVLDGDERLRYNKISPVDIDLVVGTSGDSISDLLEANDGNNFDITEVAATPGVNFTVKFENITFFDIIRILGKYDGGATHSITISLWKWLTSVWDVFESMPGTEKTFTRHDFLVIDDAPYIGQGNDFGKVWVNFNHTQMGNLSHHTLFDEVALLQVLT